MKKSPPILIISLFLLLAFSQAGFADSRGVAGSNDLTFLQQWEKSPGLSASLLFDNKDFALIHFPFIRATHTTAYQELTEYFPLVDAFLSAKELLWAEIAKWNPIPSFSGTQLCKPVTGTIRGALDSNNVTGQDHMGISLNHDVGNKKAWNVSLNLGIALQNDHSISDSSFPKLGMNISDQSENLLDHLRNAIPFIGFGISCGF